MSPKVLEGHRSITQTEWHDQVFKVSILGVEGSFFYSSSFHAHTML